MPTRTNRIASISGNGGGSGYGTGSYTTASFTPSANSILRVWVLCLSNNVGGVNGFTISGGSLRWNKYPGTWHCDASAGYAPFVELWWASVGGSPSSMTVTVDATQSIYQWCTFIDDFTGDIDLAVPFGVCGGSYNQPGAGDPGALTYNLAQTPEPTSWVEAVETLDISTAGGTVTEAAGWAQVQEITTNVPFHLMDDQTTPDDSVEYTDTYVTGGTVGAYVSMAVEIRTTQNAEIAPHIVRAEVANVTSEASTSVALSNAADIVVGRILLARIAADNSGTSGAAPTLTITDPRSNTWTLVGPANVDPGAASAGCTTWIAWARVDTAYVDGDALTLNWSPNTTAKAVVVEEWRNVNRVTPIASNTTGTGTSTFTATGIGRTPTVAGQVVYVALGAEAPWSNTYTEDTDSTEGRWTPLPRIGGTNATATNNVKIAGSYKRCTGTSAQTNNATITSRDWAAVAVLLDIVQPTPRKRGARASWVPLARQRR